MKSDSETKEYDKYKNRKANTSAFTGEHITYFFK